MGVQHVVNWILESSNPYLRLLLVSFLLLGINVTIVLLLKGAHHE